MEHSFRIEHENQVSVKELAQLGKIGIPVVRTGHIGNQYLSNLCLAACEIPIQLYDRNVLGIDTHYYPEGLIVDESFHEITNQRNILSPFVIDIIPQIPLGKRSMLEYLNNLTPAQIHFQSMYYAFKNTVIQTESMQWSRVKVLQEIIQVLTKIRPQYFSRHIDKDGQSMNYVGQNPLAENVLSLNQTLTDLVTGSAIQKEYCVGIAPQMHAVMLISAISLLAEKGFQTNIVYQLSGPSMVNYALNKKFIADVDVMYKALCFHFPWLPEEITVKIVPTFAFRFGCLGHEKDEYDLFLQAIHEFLQIQKEKRFVIKQLKAELKETGLSKKEMGKALLKDECVLTFNARLDFLSQKIVQSKFYTRMNLDLEKKDFLTQYDVLNHGTGMYVPDDIQELPIENVQELYASLNVIEQHAKRVFS